MARHGKPLGLDEIECDLCGISVLPIAAQCWRGRGRKILQILAKKHNFFLNTLYLNEVANYYSCLIDEVNLGLISARFSCLIAGFLFEVVLANFNIFIGFLLVNLGILDSCMSINSCSDTPCTFYLSRKFI